VLRLMESFAPLAFELIAPRIGTVSGVAYIDIRDSREGVSIHIRPVFDSEYFDPRPPIVRITVEPSQW
jgi:hypothetical protein